MVSALEVTTGAYRETQISLAAEYDGMRGWWLVSMPLNNELGRVLGIPYGYPKYLAWTCHKPRPGRRWDYRIDGLSQLYCSFPKLRIRWQEDESAEPLEGSSIELTFEEPGFSIGPDGCLKASRLSFSDSIYEREFVGFGKVSSDFRTGWAPLLPDGTYPMTRFVKYGLLGLGAEDLECGL